MIYKEVLRQAGMLASNDMLFLLCLATAMPAPITPLFRKGQVDGKQEILL